MARNLFAPLALLPEGWVRDLRLEIAEGRILGLTPNSDPRPGDDLLAGRALLPAPSNLHSHTFQRAMAGMTERRGPSPDSFWTWRRLMYKFLDHLTPDQVEAIAAFAFVEMLEAGFAAVAEFHYLHHRPGGGAYDNPAEMSERIAAAAAAAGIGLTLLPVLYTYGGAGAAPLDGGQLRFGCDLDRYLALIAARPRLAADGVVGTAPHSLRATTPDELRALTASGAPGPRHIHAAEQVEEVAQIKAWLGTRPVDFLLSEIGLDPRWCLIHATQMTETETRELAVSGAVAGLCPITEASLGDGIFNGPDFLAAGGTFGLGTDSNIQIGLSAELRQLEYSQRLRDRARNVLAPAGASTGAALYEGALRGGARALGRETGAIRTGAWADLVTLDREHDSLMALDDGQLIDGFIFTDPRGAVRDVWSAGRHVVREGHHVARARIERGWRETMTTLRALI
ncbi:formimidoylglutamate deiminase [Amaricoccus solimangrovi]|uniref:formimidoylglutamate deiminase n=1 Tax=Amaricoccus solimangrovi TaxID=2589815 RepID=UPI001F257DEB|nr:formimidoylglutamate deiminase [Amaricoccus solimangrovi]